MACKTYARGLVFIMVYHEGYFYVVMQDGEGDQVRFSGCTIQRAKRERSDRSRMRHGISQVIALLESSSLQRAAILAIGKEKTVA